MVAKKVIISMAGFVTVALVLVLVARKFQIGTVFGSAIDDTKSFFEDNFGFIGDSIQGVQDFLGFNAEPDNSSKIAGETVTLADGTQIHIPDDTIVNPDGTVSGSSPELQLTPEEEARITELIQDQKRSTEQFNTIIESGDISTDGLLSISDTLNALANEEVLRDSDGTISQGFTSGETALRIAQTTLATEEGRFKDIETGETISFGGFDSALEQELALREAIRKSKEENPEFFA